MRETSVSRRRRCYDAEFKQNAVGLVQAGRPIKEVAFDLGISTWTLRDWVYRQQTGRGLSQAGTLANETPQQRENRRLRQENDYLRVQRDILKKALAIVSEGPLNSASNS
jgi:transposase